MTLKIEITNINSAEASSICAICSGAVEEVNKKKTQANDILIANMAFSCKTEETSPIAPRESTPFTRYMQKGSDTHKGEVK